MEMPLVSVIVPMYNTASYVGDLIESCRTQTLGEFELIIVDDCSTDNSCEVVESHIPKLGGRLKLIRTFRNEGPGVKRNWGLELSRGKYIFFADSDDLLTQKSLEQFYGLAEKYQTDVINCRRHYYTEGTGENFVKNLKLYGDPKDTRTEIVLDDTAKRLQAWTRHAFEMEPWTKFCRRDFLIENDIKFLPTAQEDSVWTFELICVAKKMLMIPNICYIRRVREDSLASVSLKREMNVRSVRNKMDRIVRGFRYIDEFMDRVEFFRENPDERYKAMRHLLTQNVNWIRISATETGTSPRVVYENLREAFKNDTGEFEALIPFLLSNNVRLVKELIEERQKIRELTKKLGTNTGAE